jgi:hypothetical protein
VSPVERYQPIPLDWMTGLSILLSILHQSHRIEVEYGIWVFSAPQAYLGLLLVVAIFVRVVLLQRILKDVHCVRQNYQVVEPQLQSRVLPLTATGIPTTCSRSQRYLVSLAVIGCTRRRI